MISGEDEAVCIRHWDYSETSQTVGLFTRRSGVVRAMARGSRRPRSQFSGGIDLLTLARVTLVERGTSDLSTLATWDLIDGFLALRRARRAGQIAYYGAELIGKFFQSHDPHERAFDAFVGMLKSLGHDGPRESDEALLLSFQWIVLKESGYQPALGACTDGIDPLHFDPRHGGTLSDGPTPTSWRVRRSTIQFLTQVIGQAIPP